ncbi:MAG: hypothetical protein KC496_02900, partial [Anaerolineae bacterium]|nr:hypothetical protein [Anaerolineae bacterium]
SHLEQPEQALRQLQMGLQALEGTELQRFFTFADLYIGLASLCEMLYRAEVTHPSLDEHYKTANKSLMSYAKNYIPAQSAAALHSGWYAHYTGAADARKKIEQALAHAQTYQLPYDEMMAHIAIAAMDQAPAGAAAQRAQELAQQIQAPNPIRRLTL